MGEIREWPPNGTPVTRGEFYQFSRRVDDNFRRVDENFRGVKEIIHDLKDHVRGSDQLDAEAKWFGPRLVRSLIVLMPALLSGGAVYLVQHFIG